MKWGDANPFDAEPLEPMFKFFSPTHHEPDEFRYLIFVRKQVRLCKRFGEWGTGEPDKDYERCKQPLSEL